MAKSLIGKKYAPRDNSWSVNVTDCGDILTKAKHVGLAGDYKNSGVECTIVSEPFKCNTRTTGLNSTKSVHEMIMVEYRKETHMVLFDSQFIID